MNKYYVYIHYKESDGLPFYVGKGSSNRAWMFTKRNRYWNRVKNKHGVVVEILFDGLTEDEAFQCEKDAILELRYFGYPLTNMTNGGDGVSGLVFSDESRMKSTLSNRGRVPPNKGTSRRPYPKQKRPCASGALNHFADNTEYTFVRLVDGFEVTCSRHYLAEHYGANTKILKKLFYKSNPRTSADGWKLKGHGKCNEN